MKNRAIDHIAELSRKMFPKLSDNDYSDKISLVSNIIKDMGGVMDKKTLETFKAGLFMAIGVSSEGYRGREQEIVEIMKPSMKALIAVERYISEHNL